MYFVHNKCGGRVDIETRTCLKCGKKWNPISFRLTWNEIRPIVGREVLSPHKKGTVPIERVRRAVQKAQPARKKYASWGDKVPGVPMVASMLPNWPRWARLLVTATIIAIVVWIIIWLT